MPSMWANIVSRYNDVYLIRGQLTRKAIFTKINIQKAYALILLAGRNELTKVFIPLSIIQLIELIIMLLRLKTKV